MGEYEPNDSRNVTQKKGAAPGEPPRTGPREDEARARSERGKTTGQPDPAPRETGRR